MNPVRILTAILIVAAASTAVGDVDAATIVVSYERGHPDVLINGYRTQAMGTFRLDDGGTQHLALCIEAHESHSTRQDAYAATGNQVDSAELDALLWVIERDAALDDDRAVAAASLAWYYAGARRTIGPLVWSDGNRGFAPIAPLSPEPWDALAPFSLTHMIGLRSGYTELDRVETSIAALHRQVVTLRGPWTLEAFDRRFRLTGPAGPIAGQPVRLSVRPTGGVAHEDVYLTDPDGWVDPGIDAPIDGATVTASADSPGVHQEWDGDASIQRMSTATNREVTAGFDVAPLPRYIHVQKVSTDPTIGVAGGEFGLLDGAGTAIGTATTDAAGIARFAPVDPATHPGPYLVRETAAPPGLDRSAPDTLRASLSSDPQRPTVVEMVDSPLTTPVTIRKRLSESDVGPPDRSGFVFTINRRADDWSDEAVTDQTGTADPVELALGVYDVCEQSVPDWAESLIDGGCVELVIDLEALNGATSLEVDYVNVVPSPSIDTMASDATDGDRELFTAGGSVVDSVDLSDLLPGTSYVLTGLVIDPTSGDAIASAQSTFVADSTSMQVELPFEIPPLPPGTVVITEQLLVAGRVVAEHRDLDDPDQTLSIISPPTTSTTAPTTTSTTTTTTTKDSPTTTAPVPSTAPPSLAPAAVTTTTTSVPAAPATTRPQISPPTLPRTGNDAAATLLRVGDVGFVLGVGLVALVSFLPRRDERPTLSA